MAGTVVSTAVEAVVGVVAGAVVGGVSAYLVGKHRDMASRRHNVERLEIAHTELELALERSKNLPITDVSLLRKRKIIVCAYEECGLVLHKCKLQALEDRENEQAVTRRPSFPKRIARTTRSSISSLGKGVLGCSHVGRFERLADVAREFRVEVESGCSLRQYMFMSPLVRPLLQGKTLLYRMVQGSRSHDLVIVPACFEGRGVEAWLRFRSKDLKMPTRRSFDLLLGLRLSESTDMVGIAIECLQSLGPPLKPVAEFAMGELALLPAQDVRYLTSPDLLLCENCRRRLRDHHLRHFRPDPLCCRANAHTSPCASNSVSSSSEISYRFPEQVIVMGFHCYIPGFDEHDVQINSPDRAARNVVARNGSPLVLAALFVPHKPCEVLGDSIVTVEVIGGRDVRINGCSLREMEEMVRGKAIDYFVRQPQLTEYRMHWHSAHGWACVTVKKPITESKGRSKTRRVAKRRK